jgi:cysteine desulfurase
VALRLAYDHAESNNQRIAALRDRLIDEITAEIPDVQLTGHPTNRLPNNTNFVFKYIEGEAILLNLDLDGICASSGSACTTGEAEPSFVLTAMGIPPEIAHGSLRLTLGRENTDADVDYVMSILPGIVEKLRMMSPLYAAR